MKKASISDAKNRLSALLDRVRQGHRVVIEDRGIPVATLEPVVGRTVNPEGRLLRLERQGLVRRPSKPFPKALLTTRPPRTLKGQRASDVVIEERSHGR